MMYQDNDTLNKGQQNKNQSNADKSKNKEAMTAKLLASMAAGIAAGAGATYAAEHLFKTEEAQEADAVQENVATTDSQQSAEPTVEERVAKLEEKERIREQQEQAKQQEESTKQKQEENKPTNNPKIKHEDNIFNGHEVKIESVEDRTLDDGTTVQVYSGTVDGHQAVFMSDGNGRVVAAIVDANDNGDVERNEIIDLRESNVTTQYLAQHQVAPQPENEINVISVEHDVEVQGHTVDVAVVSMNNEEVMLVDVNQNGEVDVAIADQNHNGIIDQDEAQDVSDAHITMPKEEDITGNLTANNDGDTEDYSNNADITLYDA